MANLGERLLQDKILAEVEKAVIGANKAFFKYAWREKLGEVLKAESRYDKLMKWCNNEIGVCTEMLTALSPAKKTDEYTNAMFKTWQDACTRLGVLCYAKEMLLDDNSNSEIRTNIEYLLSKLYGIKWSDNLNDYI